MNTIVLEYSLKSGQLIPLTLLSLKVILDLVDILSELNLELSLNNGQNIFLEGDGEGGMKEKRKLGRWEEEKHHIRQCIKAVVEKTCSLKGQKGNILSFVSHIVYVLTT